MHVLISAFACQPGRGSEPGVGWEWPNALSRISDHDITVLTDASNREAIEAHLARHPNKRIRFRYVAVRNRLRRFGSAGHYLYYYLWQLRALLSLLHTGEWRHYDLIHHLTYGGIRTGSLLWLLPRPFMFGPLGGGESAPPRLSARLGPGNSRIERLRGLLNTLSRVEPNLLLMQARATRVLAKTPETGRLIGLFQRKLRIGIEIGTPRAATRPRAQVAGAPLQILFAGKLLYWKGCDFLIDALALLDRADAGIAVTVAGSGERGAAIGAKIARLRHIPVEMPGQIPQARLFDLYRGADLFVFPSLHDSSGNVVLEAMTFALPVVCFDLGGPPLIVGDTGIVVPVKDADHDEACRRLAAAIAALRDDPTRRAALSAAASRRAATLTWENAVRTGYGPLLFADDAMELPFTTVRS